MDFSVHHNNTYKELTIDESNVRVSTGLLSPDEQVRQVVELLRAAEDLIPFDFQDAESAITEVRQQLENRSS